MIYAERRLTMMVIILMFYPITPYVSVFTGSGSALLLVSCLVIGGLLTRLSFLLIIADLCQHHDHVLFPHVVSNVQTKLSAADRHHGLWGGRPVIVSAEKCVCVCVCVCSRYGDYVKRNVETWGVRTGVFVLLSTLSLPRAELSWLTLDRYHTQISFIGIPKKQICVQSEWLLCMHRVGHTHTHTHTHTHKRTHAHTYTHSHYGRPKG